MPVAQKVAGDVVFRRFQGEGVEFFLSRTLLTSPQKFLIRDESALIRYFLHNGRVRG